jgi:ATP-dependent DNA helicase RecG
MKRESQNIEYKESWRDEYLKWICGFANAQGGVLCIGKSDAGMVTGVVNAKRLMEELPNRVRDLLGILVEVNLHTKKGLDYLEIVVEPYPYPISYKGQYHYRSGSTKQELKGAALDHFLLQKQGKAWDGVPVPHVSPAHLDAAALARFRQLSRRSGRIDDSVLDEPDETLIEKLRLWDGQYLKRAALLLFHPDPERFVTGAYIKIGFFRTNTDLLYQDEVHGNLFAQIEQAMEILKTKYLKAGIRYEGIQRIEELPVPNAALREALLNAVVHRDYSSGSPVQISVYNDRLMIWNSGTLPEKWSLATLLGKHSSQPFNPDIANAFFRAGEIEAWGRGVERIFAACREAGMADPVVKTEASGLWIIFEFSQIAEGVATELGERLGERLGEKLGENRLAILYAMKENPAITGTQLADLLGLSDTAIENNINFLKKNGYIRRTGPARGGRWEVIEK